MKKFKYLVVNGCSYSAGANMYENQTNIQEKTGKNRFSKLLSNKLKCEEINLSKPGASNGRIFRTTFDWIQNNKEKVDNTLFVIGITGLTRLDLFSNKSKEFIITTYLADRQDILKELTESLGCSLDEFLNWRNFQIEYLMNHNTIRKHTERECILLDNFVNNNVVFFNAISSADISIKSLKFLEFYNESEKKVVLDWQGIGIKNHLHPNESQHKDMSENLFKFIKDML
jgi:hypothetical protein